MSKTTTLPHQTVADSTEAVDAFMAALDHPFKTEIETLRRVILSAAPGIAEGIKWKSPSFRTGEYFATVNLRAKAGVGVILHFGAKVRQMPDSKALISDPEGLLKWLAADRAVLEFADRSALLGSAAAIQAVIRQWTAVMDANTRTA